MPSLVKLPRHRKFDFEPRFYDPIKEEIEERVSKIHKEMDEDEKAKNNPDYIPRIRFDRNPTITKKFDFGLQFYLMTFLLLDLFIFVKMDNISNVAWIMILLAEAFLVYKKAKTIQ